RSSNGRTTPSKDLRDGSQGSSVEPKPPKRCEKEPTTGPLLASPTSQRPVDGSKDRSKRSKDRSRRSKDRSKRSKDRSEGSKGSFGRSNGRFDLLLLAFG